MRESQKGFGTGVLPLTEPFTIISVATTLFGYALEIIGKALSELVKEGNLKRRVLNAASQLVLAPETDLPDHLKK